MGSEQSVQAQNSASGNAGPRSGGAGPKLQRGHTIATPGGGGPADHHATDTPSPSFASGSSRPVSPPISVCSDSDLPYISYTDRPIGDSPKIRNKLPATVRGARVAQNPPKRQASQPSSSATTRKTTAHNVIVVNPALKDGGLQLNEEIIKLKVHTFVVLKYFIFNSFTISH